MVLYCTNRDQGTISQWCWPDGGALLDQQSIVVDIFGIVRNEIGSILNEQRN